MVPEISSPVFGILVPIRSSPACNKQTSRFTRRLCLDPSFLPLPLLYRQAFQRFSDGGIWAPDDRFVVIWAHVGEDAAVRITLNRLLIWGARRYSQGPLYLCEQHCILRLSLSSIDWGILTKSGAHVVFSFLSRQPCTGAEHYWKRTAPEVCSFITTSRQTRIEIIYTYGCEMLLFKLPEAL